MANPVQQGLKLGGRGFYRDQAGRAEMANPVQQGLKPAHSGINQTQIKAEMANPVQQGLKQFQRVAAFIEHPGRNG